MYFKLAAAILLPVLVTVILYLLDKRSPFGKLNHTVKQIIFGIVFGAVAVFGTEFSIDVGGGGINVRDAAPLCAGLIFGAPAGIIAGIIGGVERWFAVLWGAGMYARVACSVATVLAGFYSAALRKFLFDDKKPTWSLGFAIGIVIEVVHLSILFLTHLNDSARAMEIVKLCTAPMLLGNGTSVALSIIAVVLISGENLSWKGEYKQISLIIQRRLLICVLLAYGLTMIFTLGLQNGMAKNNAEALLRYGIEDAGEELRYIDPADTDAIEHFVQNRRVGETGHIIVTDKGSSAVSEALTLLSDEPSPGRLFEAEVYGEKSLCMYGTEGEHTLIATLPDKEAYYDRNVMMYVNSFMEVIIFAIFFAVIYILIKRLVVDNIRKVNTSLSKITGGNLSVEVNVRSSEEFSSLSDDINTTVAALKGYISEAAARIEAELEFAKQIQLSAMPGLFPPFPNRTDFDIYAAINTAKEVGGDFYDFYFVGENRLAFSIADVSGKGIPAAMFMMTAKTVIKNLAETGLEPDEVLTRANNKLCEGNDADMFVTAWLGIIDLKTGVISYANAGHNPPCALRNNSETELVRSHKGLVLGGMEGVTYKKYEMRLGSGDALFLYTDGVTEATDGNNELYGEDRLLKTLHGCVGMTAEQTVNTVKRNVDRFVGSAEQFDDITMLMLKYNGTAK